MNNYYYTTAPDGTRIQVPTVLDKTQDIYCQLKTPEDYLSYYQQQGYVIKRNLIDPHLCEQLKQAFQTTIKPYSGYLYRQVTGSPEKHQLSSQGYILNALLNIQDLESRKFHCFKQLGLKLLTDTSLKETLETLVGESVTLVQSMFFEGNSATWSHQDTYYLDSHQLGRMVGIWIALEEINPQAGRFFVYPQSHRLELPQNRGEMSIATHHQTYKQTILDLIKTSQLSCYAPYLQAGDVLFWKSHTIHGSLKTDNPSVSRCSLTAHYIPQSSQLLQYQKRIIPLNLEKINDLWVHHPKNLDRLSRKLIFQLEIWFPDGYKWLRQKAIQRITQ